MPDKETQKLIFDEMSEKILKVAEEMSRKEGARSLNVRKILKALNVTNRVFYNRFHNIDEVLAIIYERLVIKMQSNVNSEINPEEDYFGYVKDLALRTLTSTYDLKMEFSSLTFEHNNITENNRLWWTNRVVEIIKLGKKLNLIKDVSEEKMAYSIWCILRGYSQDALGRNLSREETLKNFEFGFDILIDGVKK